MAVADAAAPVVLDTNVALDLLLFEDPCTLPLRAALAGGGLCWIATAAMAAEFVRVLGYPALRQQCQARGRAGAALVAAYRRAAVEVAPPPGAPVACDDPDDQGFVDLAVAHRALLLSRDHALLRLRARLAPLGVRTRQAL